MLSQQVRKKMTIGMVTNIEVEILFMTLTSRTKPC